MKTFLFAFVLLVQSTMNVYAQQSEPPHRCSSIGKSDWCTVLDRDSESFSKFGDPDKDYFYEARHLPAFEKIHDTLLNPRYDNGSDHRNSIDDSNGFIALAIVVKKCQTGPCKIELRNPRVEINSTTHEKELVIQYFRNEPNSQNLQSQQQRKALSDRQLLIVTTKPLGALPGYLQQNLQSLNITNWNSIPHVAIEVMGYDGSVTARPYAVRESRFPAPSE